MKILDYLLKENIFYDFKAENKADFFSNSISCLLEKHIDFDEDRIIELFLEREKTMSTGIGNGIAIPHITYDKFEKPLIYLFRLETPIDFKSLDNQRVGIIFVLIGSTRLPSALHIQTLAKLGRLMKNDSFITELMQAEDANNLYGILQKYD